MKNQKRLAFFTVMTAAMLVLGGCASSKTSNTAESAKTSASAAEATTETASAADTKQETTKEPVTVKPLPSGFDLKNLKDCTPHVSFTTDDFNWRGGNVKADIYATLLYDTVDVHTLAEGDSIVVGKKTVKVKTIEDTKDGRLINGGTSDEILLAPAEGGTYEIWGEDDQPEMENLGSTTIILSQKVKLTDCTDNPGETVEVGPDEIKIYLEDLPEERKTFNPNCTTILIENGEATEIKRVWVP